MQFVQRGRIYGDLWTADKVPSGSGKMIMGKKAVSSPKAFLDRVNGYGNWVVLVPAALWVMALFFMWAPLQAVLLELPMVGLSVDDFDKFSNEAAWWPLASDVASGTLFPVAPALGEGAQGIGFYPYLTLWAHGLLIAIFGIEGTAWIGVLLLPTVIFVLLVLVYQQYLPWRWSLSMAALGIVTFIDFPFREFLLGVLAGRGWHDIGTLTAPALLHFPFPVFSLIGFLAVFLISIRSRRLTGKNIWIITLLWGLQFQIHIINGVIGAIFWPVYLTLRLWRQDRGKLSAGSVKNLIAQGIIFAFLLSPTIVTFFAAQHIAPSSANIDQTDLIISVAFGYLFLPVAAISLLYYLEPIDLFELRSRFLAVWVLLATELVLMIMNVLTGFGPNPDLIVSRIGFYFIHIFAFVPVVYYLVRPGLEFVRQSPLEREVTRLKRFIRWCTHDASYVYLPLFFITLTFFAVASARSAYIDAAEIRAPVLKKSVSQVHALYSEPSVGAVMAEEPAANLLIPIMGEAGSLWVNRFGNQSSEIEAIERFALYARLAGWNEGSFVAFMAPSDNRAFTVNSGQIYLISQSKITAGLGYWLLRHNLPISKEGRDVYIATVKKVFKELDVTVAVKKFNLSRLFLSADRLPSEISHKTRVLLDGVLIDIE